MKLNEIKKKEKEKEIDKIRRKKEMKRTTPLTGRRPW